MGLSTQVLTGDRKVLQEVEKPKHIIIIICKKKKKRGGAKYDALISASHSLQDSLLCSIPW